MVLNDRLKSGNQNFLLLLIINALFFITCAYLFPIRFEANDDVTMLLIASGKYTGIPDAHLVFINYVYGTFLKFLYTWNRQIEWYSVLFAVFHIVCISVIAWFILTKDKFTLLYKLLFLAVFYSLELRSIMLFQFTTTAALCAVAGLLLIAEGKKYQKCFGVILFVLSGLIRLDATLLIFLIISPVFLKDIFINGRLIFSKSLFFLLIALLITGSLKFIDYAAYHSNTRWSYYEKYNKIRGKINDNQYVNNIKLPANIAFYDYDLLVQCFPDGHIMTYDKLLTIKNALKKVKFKTILLNVLTSLKPFKLILIVVLISCVLFFLYSTDKKIRFIFFLSFCLFLFAFIYISSFGSLKSRVFNSSLMGLFAAIFVLSQNSIITYTYIKKAWVLSLVLFTLLFFRQTIIYRTLDINFRKFQFSQQKELMNNYLQNPANSVVPFLTDYLIEFYSPFAEINFKPGQMLFSGWSTTIPFNRNKFDSYLDLIDRHAIFIKKDYGEKFFPLIQKSILANYGIKVIPEKEMESRDYMIVKLKRFSTN